MNSWIGHNSSELAMRWGPPTSSQEIGGGQRVLTYREWVPMFDSGYWRVRMFTVNPDGTITNWHSQGW
jgi:hypothetical protein